MHNLSRITLVYVSIEYYALLIPALVVVLAQILLNLIGLHVKFMPRFPDFNQTYIFPTGFSNISEHKLQENPFQREPSSSKLVDRRTDRQNETDSRFFQPCLRT